MSSREAFEEIRKARRARTWWSDAALAYVNVLTFRFMLSFALLSFSLGAAFVFFTSPAATSARATGRRRGWGGVAIAYGALVLYAYQVIIHTANGEDDMPLLGWEEFREELWPTLGSMAATIGFLLIPTVAATIALVMNEASEQTMFRVLAVTAGVGVFFLPVTVLAVALGGVSVLARFDLLVRTVITAPIQYIALLVALAVAAALAVGMLVVILANPGGYGLVTMILLGCAQAYFGLVSARQIGLFYRHFSDRFPWTAG